MNFFITYLGKGVVCQKMTPYLKRPLIKVMTGEEKILDIFLTTLFVNTRISQSTVTYFLGELVHKDVKI